LFINNTFLITKICDIINNQLRKKEKRTWGAYTGALEFFGSPLDIVAKEFNYDEDNILILRGDIAALHSKYPETYRNLESCTHHRDNRTALQYAQDLVASWGLLKITFRASAIRLLYPQNARSRQNKENSCEFSDLHRQ